MNYLPLILYWMLLLKTVVTSLPAPVNVHVFSLNFYHELRWDPGPGTPPGTVYLVSKSHSNKNLMVTTTSAKLRLKDYYFRFVLYVRASYNGTLSPPERVSFSPVKDTILGPPQLTLAGCGNCIKINISLPLAREDIQKIYDPDFKITWKKNGSDTMEAIVTKNKTLTLDNLTPGTEYCIQVTMETPQNKNVKPSDWSCIVMSMVESRGVFVVAGAVSVLLIILFSTVTIVVFFLYHTGFICKLKAALPRVMIMDLIQDYFLTPERTITDQVFINSETDRQKYRSAILQLATGGAPLDDEDEEQEDDQLYVNRNVELSSGIGSCQESCDVSASSKPAASVDSGNMSDRMSAEVEVEEEFDAQFEGAKDSFIPGSSQTGDTNELEEVEKEEEVCENSGSVNLFSVTLAALDVHKEEEEEEEEEDTRDFLKSDLESLLPQDSKHTQGHIDSQTETQSDDLEPADFNETEYEGNWTDTRTYGLQDCQTQREEDEEEEEEDEDEEFSEYLSHR